MTIVCSRYTVREREREFVHISLLWPGPFLGSSATAGEHTWARGTDRPACVTSRSLPSIKRPVDLSPSFEWPLDLCRHSKITDLVLFLKSQAEIWTSSLPHVFSVYRNLHTSVFFGNLLILSGNGNNCHSIHRNKLYPSPSSFIFSFLWPTLLMLSCDSIEPAKFIHGTLSLAKIVYYT